VGPNGRGQVRGGQHGKARPGEIGAGQRGPRMAPGKPLPRKRGQ
jgi:hypothetical protein